MEKIGNPLEMSQEELRFTCTQLELRIRQYDYSSRFCGILQKIYGVCKAQLEKNNHS